MVKKELSKPNGYHYGNSCFANRDGDNVIINDQFEDGYEPVSIPYEKLTHLLDEWKKFCECGHIPSEIIITMDDSYNFNIEF